MFIRVKDKPNGRKAVQVVESVRRGDKVTQQIIRHIGQGESDEEIKQLKKIGETIIIQTENSKLPVLPIFSPDEFYGQKKRKVCKDVVAVKDLREEQRVVEGIGEVFGKLYDDLNFSSIKLGKSSRSNWNSVLKSCVLSRIANPCSKLRTSSMLEQDYGIKLPVEKIYRLMNHVAEKEDEIKKLITETTQSLLKEKVDILFFDVTTLYFESVKTDELRNFGFSKDCKFNETQVVLALVATTQGLPITYKLFSGNTYEGSTLVNVVTELKKDFDIENVTLTADRGMLSKKNIEFLENEGINYVVGAKLKSFKKSDKEKILDLSNYLPVEKNSDLKIFDTEIEEKRVIVTYSNNRATKDKSDRLRLVERIEKKAKNDKINIKDAIPNYGTKKFLKTPKKGDKIEIDRKKIELAARWDGLHGVMTNIKHSNPCEILNQYKNLWQIELAFRVNKHDLKMRPIFHWKPQRIKAHILICFIAYTLVKQLIHRVRVQQKAKLSFEKIRNELLHAQLSIVSDISTKKKYAIPSNGSVVQDKIYKTVGLKRLKTPFLL